jgi:8-oxo-dGTP pyrophosphatase MutT (NUDIX family)
VTTSSAPDIEITALDRTEIAFEPWSWRFADERRAEIDRHFADIQRGRCGGVWNGRIVLLNRLTISGGTLRGACFEADFASFCAWRDWDFPDPAVDNIFAVAALQSADGAFVVGEMAPSTVSGGKIYFPCGTPEPIDVAPSGQLDLDANLARELTEETGIEIGKVRAEPGWTMVRDRRYLALLKRVTAAQNAAELRARIMRHIASEHRPEFTDIHLVRSPADLVPTMPPFVTAYLRHFWS